MEPLPISESSFARVMSIDVLRGIVIFAMIFVNDIAGGRGVPWWLEHYPGDKSGMTFVDVVFPAFLFIVGMSIPLSIESRRRRGHSWLRIFGHILLRTAGLLFVGVLMVEHPNDTAIGWRRGLWSLLMYIGVIATFASWPTRSQRSRWALIIVRCIGFLGLTLLSIKFRGPDGGHIQHSWWGILGLIGWAYLTASICYLLLRNETPAALLGAMAVLMCIYFADRAGAFSHFEIHVFGPVINPNNIVNFGEMFGSQAAITMAGVVIGSLLLPYSSISHSVARIRFAGIFMALMMLSAMLLHRTYGINKNDATPSWCLWCSAITIGLWIPLYLLIDTAGWRVWSIPLAWAGANALLIYLLHPPWIYVVALSGWSQWDRWGSYPTVAWRGLAISATLCLIGGIAGRTGFRLRLSSRLRR